VTRAWNGSQNGVYGLTTGDSDGTVATGHVIEVSGVSGLKRGWPFSSGKFLTLSQVCRLL